VRGTMVFETAPFDPSTPLRAIVIGVLGAGLRGTRR
jgi:hypothetical protein